MDRPIRPEVVKALVTQRRWGPLDARLAERSGYLCTYCDLDFFASARNYKQWSKDHRIPKKHNGPDIEENMEAACDTCNAWKGTWDPRSVVGENATREEQIAAIRAYLKEKYQKFEEEQLLQERAIVGWK